MRHKHPYSREKFIVCNLEGYAQVQSCPRELLWSETDKMCIEKDPNVYKSIAAYCRDIAAFLNSQTSKQILDENAIIQLLIPYPYSLLKYVRCNANAHIAESDSSLNQAAIGDHKHHFSHLSSLFTVEDCPTLMPFFCDRKKICVSNFFVDCLM